MATGSDDIERAMSAHYGKERLGAAILEAVRERGGDPDRPTFEDLAPFDHSHNGGRPAPRGGSARPTRRAARGCSMSAGGSAARRAPSPATWVARSPSSTPPP